jgi:hypothetical protein
MLSMYSEEEADRKESFLDGWVDKWRMMLELLPWWLM